MTITQSEELVDDFLLHYGVKGMKWGKIRSRAQIDADSDDVAVVKIAKEKIKTNRTTDVLSNKELQNVVTRMNLEQQYGRLMNESKNGNPLIKKQLDAGKAAVQSMGQRYAEDKVASIVARRNPAAGAILKVLIEKKRAVEGQGEGKKKKK